MSLLVFKILKKNIRNITIVQVPVRHFPSATTQRSSASPQMQITMMGALADLSLKATGGIRSGSVLGDLSRENWSAGPVSRGGNVQTTIPSIANHAMMFM